MTTSDRRQFQIIGTGCVLAVLIAAAVWVVSTHAGGRTVTAYFANASALPRTARW